MTHALPRARDLYRRVSQCQRAGSMRFEKSAQPVEMQTMQTLWPLCHHSHDAGGRREGAGGGMYLDRCRWDWRAGSEWVVSASARETELRAGACRLESVSLKLRRASSCPARAEDTTGTGTCTPVLGLGHKQQLYVYLYTAIGRSILTCRYFRPHRPQQA